MIWCQVGINFLFTKSGKPFLYVFQEGRGSRIKQNKFLVLSPLTLLTLASCGGSYPSVKAFNDVFASGSGSGSGSGSTLVSGNAFKGPLYNATVFLDYDNDGFQDSNETSVRTGPDGSYTLTTKNSDYTLVVVTDENTVDTSSGTISSGLTLKAPSGSSVVTPTTTLMIEGNLTANELASVLGLPTGVDPLSFNPFAAGADPLNALATEKISHQIMSVVNSFAAAAEGARSAFSHRLCSGVEIGCGGRQSQSFQS